MSKAVTFKQIKKALDGLGFEYREHGNHLIFQHSKTGVILTVPDVEPAVPLVYVNSAARQIANSGIATISTFESRLRKAAREIHESKSGA